MNERPTPHHPGADSLRHAGPLQAALTALSVSLLVVGTLGALAAVIGGVGLHIVGVPDTWATAAGGLVAAGSVIPAAGFGRRVWRTERYGLDL